MGQSGDQSETDGITVHCLSLLRYGIHSKGNPVIHDGGSERRLHEDGTIKRLIRTDSLDQTRYEKRYFTCVNNHRLTIWEAIRRHRNNRDDLLDPRYGAHIDRCCVPA